MNYVAPKSHMRPTSSSHLKQIKRKSRFTTGTNEAGEYFSLSSENADPGLQHFRGLSDKQRAFEPRPKFV